jgi:hypothetical protein
VCEDLLYEDQAAWIIGCSIGVGARSELACGRKERAQGETGGGLAAS